MNKMCVFPMPVAPCACSNNWALYTRTCHMDFYSCWYYCPLFPVSCLFGRCGTALVPECLCCWHWRCLLGLTHVTLLATSKSYVFVELVNIKQLLCWPDLTVVFFSKKYAQTQLLHNNSTRSHAKHTCLACFSLLSFLYFPCPFSCYTHLSLQSKRKVSEHCRSPSVGLHAHSKIIWWHNWFLEWYKAESEENRYQICGYIHKIAI